MHHTKQKGDIGLVKVISDLTEKGHVPCLPLSEHQPYDIVVVLKNGKSMKIQAKYASLNNNGTIEIRFRRNWSDKNGTHSEHYGQNEFDYYAIYCPDNNKVVYIPNTVDCPKAIRFDKSGNNQTHGVHWAKDYADIRCESSETIRHTPEMVKT